MPERLSTPRPAQRRIPLAVGAVLIGAAVGVAAIYTTGGLKQVSGGDPACRGAVDVAKKIAPLAKGEVAKSMVPGTHGSTYGGNPLACTIGNAVLDRVMAPGFIDHVNQMGQRLSWHLQQLQQRFPNYVLELRGKGLLAGVKLPDSIVVRDFVARLRDDHQLLTQGAGDNVLRLLPPLVITEDDIKEAVDKIAAAFTAIDSENSKEHVTA